MNGKTFFPLFFILIFIVSLTFGCTSLGGGGLADSTKSSHFQKGIFNSTILINGKETVDMELSSRQPGEVGLFLKNIGPNDINNVKIRAFGCVDFDNPLGGLNEIDTLAKDETNYMGWSIRAPQLGKGEIFTCPLIFRACFEETSEGYLELSVIPEDYSDVPAEGNFYYKGGVLTTEPNFGVLRTIKEGDGSFNALNNILFGKMKIKNIGGGWIDYLGYNSYEELGIHKIKRVSMNLEPGSYLTFYSIGDVTEDELSRITKVAYPTFTCNNVLAGDKLGIELRSGCTQWGNSNYAYLLKMISGQELDLRVGFKPTRDYTEQAYERVNYEIETGYCIDLASIDIKLSGI